ncbi:hypothetical protein BSI_35400 [Bacillus inaquosorum KCTC 13429]|uniref:YuiA family protein n=1 Tax=Bacillus inaquosorum KCTC 13429 TaxID=1236548 RepID=A0A9W5LFY6_9BACI|nr:hypothetical protein BSI_35400 [Bacillus inaquosorum KCTC 13429]
MLYYQKIKKKGDDQMKTASTTASHTCPFCSGKGYFQLILGGSETCPSCQGTGKDSHSFSSR